MPHEWLFNFTVSSGGGASSGPCYFTIITRLWSLSVPPLTLMKFTLTGQRSSLTSDWPAFCPEIWLAICSGRGGISPMNVCLSLVLTVRCFELNEWKHRRGCSLGERSRLSSDPGSGPRSGRRLSTESDFVWVSLSVWQRERDRDRERKSNYFPPMAQQALKVNHWPSS